MLLKIASDDLEFLNNMIDKTLLERLSLFLRMSLSESLIRKLYRFLTASGKKWEYPVGWGRDLQAEHERYLVEEHFKRPVILTDYPKDIKAFYMKQNDDDKTVRAMDVLFPGYW